MPAHPPRLKRLRSHQPSLKDSHHHRRFTRQRLEYCDCGELAVTVLRIRVGSDPQYTIRMPLCPACLKLEQDMEQDLHP